MRLRRAILYVPGDNLEKIQQAAATGADSICLDLEDSVAENRKQEARETVAHALKSLDFGRSERLVRINRVDSEMAQADLSAILPALPNGIMIPSVESATQIQWVSRQVSDIEQKYDWLPNSMVLLALVETAKAIIRLSEIGDSDPHLVALALGAEDLAADLGAERTPSSMEMMYVRSAIVLHAAAFRIQAIDMSNSNFRDLDALREEACQGRALGFVGKQIIHPDQVVTVQEAFTPDVKAVTDARDLVEAYQEQEKQGVGMFERDGQVVNGRVVRSAERLLSRLRDVQSGKKET